MKEIMKSKGMWLFVVFMLFVLIFGTNDNTKNASVGDTNNQIIIKK